MLKHMLMRSQRFTSSASVTLPFAIALGVFGVALAVLALTLSTGTVEHMVSEEGPIEDASEWLWVALAGMVLLVLRPITPAVVAGAYICLCCAAREASLHTALTGYSVLKIPFYYRSEHAIEAQLIAGTIMVLFIVSVVIVARRLWVLIRTRPAVAAKWSWVAIVGLGLLAITKVLDRAPAILRNNFDVDLADSFLFVLAAWEEGFEMLLPVQFGMAVLMFRVHGSENSSANRPNSSTSRDGHDRVDSEFCMRA